MIRSVPNSFVSLFCGCGGFDIGLKQEGFVPMKGFDQCPEAVAHYQRHVCPGGQVADLTQSIPKLSKPPEVVIAGPPCQGFSTAGKRDLADKRNHLLPLAGEIASDMGAKVIIVENVWAAEVGAHLKYWQELDELLRTRGYKTATLRCNAADLGLAQSRRRLLLFAWRGRQEPDFAELTRTHAQPSGRLDEALNGVEKLPNHAPEPLEAGSRDHRVALRIGPGQKLCNVRGGSRSIHTWNIPEVFGKTTAAECQMLEFIMRVRRQERKRDFGDADPVSMRRLTQEFQGQTKQHLQSLLKKHYIRKVGEDFDLCHTFNGKYRRFQWEDKACAVDTRFGEAQLFLHPNEHRPFTVREAARIQGFPDDYVFDCSKRTAFRLLGNAVPPPMGRMVATFTKGILGS